MEMALTTTDLKRHFGDFEAVKGINLNVPKGCIYGFLGPNGAGKSTTIKCLTGLLQPSAGTVRVLGLDPGVDGLEIKRRVGVVPEDLALFDRLSASETLLFVGRVHEIAKDVLQKRIEELLQWMELDQTGDKLVTDFSHGMKKKLALAAALLPGPELLFLDEPFEGIDAVASRQIKVLLDRFVKGTGTVFVTSHILEIVERMCDHLGVIDKGILVAQGTLQEVKDNTGGATLEDAFLHMVGASDDQGSLSWLS